jgi:hypothetical protein
MKRTILAAGVVLGLAASAQADVIEFTIYENADNADVSGLLLTVELVDAGSAIDFVFRNQSTSDSVITSVYFEGTDAIDGQLLNGDVWAESTGVEYENGATPSDPAQHPIWAGGDWNDTAYSAGAMSPGAHNGINETGDESATIRFDYGGGADFGSIVEALTGDPALFRIAMHIQSVGDGEFSVWGTTVPAPASASLLVIGGIMATRRRR